MSRDYVTCEGCGVALDKTSYQIEKEKRCNHDGDKTCEHLKCPVCQFWTPTEEWEDIERIVYRQK